MEYPEEIEGDLTASQRSQREYLKRVLESSTSQSDNFTRGERIFAIVVAIGFAAGSAVNLFIGEKREDKSQPAPITESAVGR